MWERRFWWAHTFSGLSRLLEMGSEIDKAGYTFLNYLLCFSLCLESQTLIRNMIDSLKLGGVALRPGGFGCPWNSERTIEAVSG